MNAIKNDLPKVFQYYRLSLDDADKDHYDKLLMGLIDYKRTIYLTGIESNQISLLFDYIRLDHPLLFYVKKLKYRYEPLLKVTIVYPQYRFDENRTNDTTIAVLNKVKSILASLTNKSDFQREVAIHDFFCVNDVYDTSLADSSFECVGPLLFNKGVCEGISKAVKLLCDYSGLQCIVLRGTTIRNDLFINSNQHTWNIIRINGAFYNLDVTFDLSLSSPFTRRYDYFNLSNNEILRDHQYSVFNYPSCNLFNCFYQSQNLCFSSLDSIKQHYTSLLLSNNKSFVIKIADESHWHIQIADILQCFDDALLASKHYYQQYQYSFNEYQSVLQIDLI